jgi:diguanylate cyclase (GGDEF)-like protein
VESAVEVAGRIRAAVAGTPLNQDGKSVATSVSIGVANYPEHGRSIDAVLARADRAMYVAKQNGRDGVVKFEG